jgi:hypothetical protein
MKKTPTARRDFLKTAAAFTGAITGLSLLPATTMAGQTIEPRSGTVPPTPVPLPAGPTGPAGSAGNLNIIGPQDGYSPQIGTLVSMMAWLRAQVVGSVKSMTTEQLDYLLDEKANTIGALLNHLAATDAFYHEHTFTGVAWGKWDPAVEKKYGAAMSLGDEGRKSIKGNNVDYYLSLLQQTRESTLAEFKKRDDQWLMTVDDKWFWGPTNNYCKWFHVCEHESHHLGQINLLKSRLPGARSAANG